MSLHPTLLLQVKVLHFDERDAQHRHTIVTSFSDTDSRNFLRHIWPSVYHHATGLAALP